MIICPKCYQNLKRVNNSLKCDNNHCFDISKSGYTNLLLGNHSNSGDNKLMVKARIDFLNKGFYEPLVIKLLEVINQLGTDLNIVDAGCGEGYYTNYLYNHTNNNYYGFDMSKDALKHASKNEKNVNYYLSSIFNLPLNDKTCDLVLNIFAPCANEEFKRILKDDGYLIKVDPNVNHLKELKGILYDEVILNKPKVLDTFNLIDKQEVEFMIDLNKDDIKNLFMMTPYYYKTSIDDSERLLSLDSLKVCASFIIYIYKK